MPNNEEKLRKEREARRNAYKQRDAQKEASNAAKSNINLEQLKNEAIPFKNIDIEKMNAQKKKFLE